MRSKSIVWVNLCILVLVILFCGLYLKASPEPTQLERIEFLEHNMQKMRQEIDEFRGWAREAQLLKNRVKDLEEKSKEIDKFLDLINEIKRKEDENPCNNRKSS
jgi:prefoldin subunit 5